MSILFLLIPLGMLFLAVAIWAFLWAVRSGQFEDMEGPAHRILMDDDDPKIPHYQKQSHEKSKEKTHSQPLESDDKVD